MIPGHEYAGTVEAVADDVTASRSATGWWSDPNLPCGQCAACRKGLTNLCVSLKAYGVTHNGGFADLSLVKVDHLHPIGDMPFHIAALAEPLACVANGLTAANVIGKDADRARQCAWVRRRPDRASDGAVAQGAGRGERHGRRHQREPPRLRREPRAQRRRVRLGGDRSRRADVRFHRRCDRHRRGGRRNAPAARRRRHGARLRRPAHRRRASRWRRSKSSGGSSSWSARIR